MNDKKKRNLIIALCILAVVVAISAIIVSPFGRKATKKPHSETTTETVQQTQKETASTPSTESTTFVIPPSTDPVVNPNKNYTFFIDTSTFEFTENDEGVTSLVAKENSNVKMTVTPVRDRSYKQCCRDAEAKHKELGKSAQLKIENTNTVYRSQTGSKDKDIITTVYCVDDNKGGCIVIEYQTPVSATEYAKTIEIMLSMFKVQ